MFTIRTKGARFRSRPRQFDTLATLFVTIDITCPPGQEKGARTHMLVACLLLCWKMNRACERHPLSSGTPSPQTAHCWSPPLCFFVRMHSSCIRFHEFLFRHVRKKLCGLLCCICVVFHSVLRSLVQLLWRVGHLVVLCYTAISSGFLLLTGPLSLIWVCWSFYLPTDNLKGWYWIFSIGSFSYFHWWHFGI